MNLIGTAPVNDFASAKSKVGEYFDWWVNELGNTFAKVTAGRGAQNVALYKSDLALSLFVRGKGAWVEKAQLSDATNGRAQKKFRRAVAKATARKNLVPIRLAPDQVLRRTLQVPKAALDVIEPVVRNQIQRFTPWPEEESLFGFHAINSETAGEQVDVVVVITQKTRVEALLKSVEDLGIKPTRVEYAEAGIEGIIVLDTFGTEPAAAAARAVKTGLRYAAIGFLAVGILGAFYNWQVQNRLSSVNASLSSAQSEIEAANEAAGEGAWFMQNGAALLKLKRSSPSTISVMDELSKRLPVSAYLTGLEITGDKVQLTGKAKNAAELIAALESSPLLKEVTFAAPTIRLPEERREAFTITAKVSTKEEGELS